MRILRDKYARERWAFWHKMNSTLLLFSSTSAWHDQNSETTNPKAARNHRKASSQKKFFLTTLSSSSFLPLSEGAWTVTLPKKSRGNRKISSCPFRVFWQLPGKQPRWLNLWMSFLKSGIARRQQTESEMPPYHPHPWRSGPLLNPQKWELCRAAGAPKFFLDFDRPPAGIIWLPMRNLRRDSHHQATTKPPSYFLENSAVFFTGPPPQARFGSQPGSI